MQQTLDRLAVGASLVCAAHCIVLPVVTSLLPIALASMGSDATFHGLMLFLILPSSLVAGILGCRKHHDIRTALLIGVGIGIVAMSALLGHSVFGYNGERIVTTLGGAVLSTGHILNYMLCRRAHCSHEENT